jgi:uncharacterized membrane-anchored protein
MSKEYTYVIVYKEDEGWEIDTESEEQFFPNGTIYDNETTQWEHGYLGDGEFNADEKAVTEQLYKALRQMNGED